MGEPLVTSRAATDPVVYEHTLLSVRPPKGVTYKQVLHPKHVYFELVPNFKKSELVQIVGGSVDLQIIMSQQLLKPLKYSSWNSSL